MDPKMLQRQDAILSSMTKEERKRPDLLNASRRRRIAAGSGTSVQDVNKLLKSFEQMRGMMKKLKKMMGGGMMKQMMKMAGGAGGIPSMDDIQGQMGNMNMGGGNLGQNPFQNMRGGDKSKRKKKK